MAVESLYHYGEHYFDNHSLVDASCKNEDIAKKLHSTLATLNNFLGELTALV